MVNVTKSNFIEQSNDLIKHLPTAAFVALDEEMTGISLPWSKRPSKDDTPSKRFESTRGAPERYSIIQVGIALFHEHPAYDPLNSNSAEFLVRRYNFYVFPPSINNRSGREVTMNPSTVAFLNKNNMSFDRWTKEGIPYVETGRAETLMAKHKEELIQLQQEAEGQESPISNGKNRRKVVLTRLDDISFHARAMANLREWIDSSNRAAARAAQRQGDAAAALDPSMSFLLPQCNSFLRRALYESIQAEYPALILERGGTDAPNQIRVWRLNPEQQEQRLIRLAKEKWENLMLEQVGFWRVFYALSSACRGLHEENSVALVSEASEIDLERDVSVTRTGRQVPIVVHNGWMDLMFMFTHFHCQKLPDSYEETKRLVHEYFPVVYDTKVLSSEYCLDFRVRSDSTTLLKLHETLIVQDILNSNPIIVFDNQGNGEAPLSTQEHEAEYDAFMTGAIFATLCKNILDMKGERFRANYHVDLDASDESQTNAKDDDDDDDDNSEASNESDVSFVQDGSSKRGFGSLVHLLAPTHDQDVRRYFGRNKIFFFNGLYTMDLEEPAMDPLKLGMSKEFTYRVCGIDTTVSTRDITGCLSGIGDYELVWVDDTTFMIAAKTDEGEAGESRMALRRNAQAIFGALRARFSGQTIITLDEHLKRVAAQEAAEARFGKGIHSRLAAWVFKTWHTVFGRKKRPISEDGESRRPNKRQRVS